MAEISPAIEQLEAASRSAGAARSGELGELRVGITTSLAGGQLRELADKYIKKYPQVAFDVHDGSRVDHLMAVKARQLDAAIVTGCGPVHGFEVKELWHERVYVALSESHPLAAKVALGWPDLEEEEFIVSRRDPGPEVRKYIVLRSGIYGANFDIKERAASQDTILNLVALGQGITLVSAAWTTIKVPGLTLRPLHAETDFVPCIIVWASKNENPAFRKFLQMIPSRHALQYGQRALVTTREILSATLCVLLA